MSVYRVSHRYARALMGLAEEKKIFEKVSDDMLLVYNALKGSKELRTILSNPIIKEEKKLSILEAVFKSKVTKDSMEFVNFIVKKNREDVLYEIAKHFLELRNEKLGIIEAEVFSVEEFSKTQKANMQKKLEDYTKKKVELSFKVNPLLIGGFLIKYSNKIVDASVKNQLSLLRKKLLEENQFSNN